MTPAGRARLRAAIRRLVRYFDENKPALVVASSSSNYDRSRRNAVLAKQVEEYFRVSRTPGGGQEGLEVIVSKYPLKSNVAMPRISKQHPPSSENRSQ